MPPLLDRSVAAALRAGAARELPLARAGRRWVPILSTEDAVFSPEPRPPRYEKDKGSLHVDFSAPAAVVFAEEETG